MTPVSTRARCWPDDAAGDPQRHAVATGYVLPSNAVAGVRIGSPWQAPAIIGYAECAMTPYEFIAKWRASALKERSASQEHFIDLCRLLGEPTPAEADPAGETYCFERGARKDTGGAGWADVWKSAIASPGNTRASTPNLDSRVRPTPAVRGSRWRIRRY